MIITAKMVRGCCCETPDVYKMKLDNHGGAGTVVDSHAGVTDHPYPPSLRLHLHRHHTLTGPSTKPLSCSSSYSLRNGSFEVDVIRGKGTNRAAKQNGRHAMTAPATGSWLHHSLFTAPPPLRLMTARGPSHKMRNYYNSRTSMPNPASSRANVLALPLSWVSQPLWE